MLLARRAVAASAAALITSGLALVSPLLVSPADAAEVLVDGGFELAVGDPPISPGWTSTDSVYSSGFCTPDNCSPDPGAPHTGHSFYWFGDTLTPGHTSVVSQDVTLPVGSATLSYWLQDVLQSTGSEASLEVLVDGQAVSTLEEPEAVDAGYVLHSLDISEFADGHAHTLAFSYAGGSAGDNLMTLDDVSVNATAGTPGVDADSASLGAIPDASGCGGLQTAGDPLNVSFQVGGKVGLPTDVAVRMAFDPPHSYAGDLTAVLIAPNGLKTSLFSALYYGGAGGNLVGPYLFSDTAPATPTFESEATNSSVAPPGHYRASGYSDPLITPTFASLGNANGTWILRVRDFCSGDVGSISAATLFVTTTGVAPDGDGDGIPDATDDCPGKAGVAPSGCPDKQAPDTAFLTTPPHGVAKRLTVPFGFVSTEVGSTYQCSLDGSAFAGCPNPTSVTVKPGRHTFRVAARDASGNVDPYPASATFRAYDCPTLTKAVTKLGKHHQALKKAVKTTKAKLVKAQASGDQAAVKALEDKLDKLLKKEHKVAKKLAKAKQAAKPCKVKAGISLR